MQRRATFDRLPRTKLSDIKFKYQYVCKQHKKMKKEYEKL